MKVGDKFICIKYYRDLLTLNKEYKLMEIDGNKYWFDCDNGGTKFIKDHKLDQYFISLKECRKRKLKKIGATI
jgi:hypothetical protein